MFVCIDTGFINNQWFNKCKGTMTKEFEPFNENELKDSRWESCCSRYGTDETENEEIYQECNGQRFMHF